MKEALSSAEGIKVTASTKEDTKSESSPSGFIPAFFSPNTTHFQTRYLYRGDSRAPQEIFLHGFSPRGTDMDLFSHINPIGSQWNPNSGYISTSTSKEIAAQFPKDFVGTAYRYEINHQKKGIDARDCLILKFEEGQLEKEDLEFYIKEKDVCVPHPHRIDPQAIKGAQEVEFSFTEHDGITSEVQKVFIANAKYIAPVEVQLVTAAKIIGCGVTFVAAAIDIERLIKAYEHSQRVGNFNHFHHEATAVIGGWGSATVCALSMSEGGAFVGTTFGPIGTVVGGLMGGVAGSVVGYFGGSWLAGETYDALSSNDESADCSERDIEPKQCRIQEIDSNQVINAERVEQSLTRLSLLSAECINPPSFSLKIEDQESSSHQLDKLLHRSRSSLPPETESTQSQLSRLLHRPESERVTQSFLSVARSMLNKDVERRLGYTRESLHQLPTPHHDANPGRAYRWTANGFGDLEPLPTHKLDDYSFFGGSRNHRSYIVDEPVAWRRTMAEHRMSRR